MGHKKILLVEDNPDDVELTLRVLRKNYILNEVVVAVDGPEALDYLFCTGAHSEREVHDTPAVILLDLKLPKIGGLEVLRQIRHNDQTKQIPVVLLTSSDEEEALIDSYKLGVNSYIRKPIDFDQFTEAVQQMALYWLVWNKPPPSRKGDA
jgi:CheY-like chemotaxis protein